jgi:hypothetical protein
MRARWLVTGLVCWAVVAPMRAAAQEPSDVAKDAVHEAVRTIFGPHWKLYVHGGLSIQGRLMVQRTAMVGVPTIRGPFVVSRVRRHHDR